MKALNVSVLLCSFFVLAGCGGSPGNESPSAPNTTALDQPDDGVAIQGRTYDVTLSSNIDNADIAITIHEPEDFVGGAVYPLILHSHGYSGSRQAERPELDSFIGQFLANGYGVLSLDERGNGESGGEVRILDPALEGQDWLQVLDWTENNLEWLEYDPAGFQTGLGKGNPVMGAIGGSYGGGYQNMVYAIDNKRRLDAIAPDITWNDLRYSLFSGGVFKSLWGTLLAGLGSRPPNRQHQEVQEGLAQGNGQNNLDDGKLALLYKNSLESHCRGENDFTTIGGLRPMDAFYTQSHLDTLFNFNDAYHNFDCVRQLGGDVRLLNKFVGHGLNSGDGTDQCGVITRQEATLAWYNEKLKGQAGAADYIPGICYNLGSTGTDGIVVDDVTLGGTESASFSLDNVTIGDGSTTISIVPDALFTAPAGGEILAGIPTIDLTINNGVIPPVGDPIVFVGLGVRRDGINPTRSLMNQITPFRGAETHTAVELVGVFERLEEGDEVVLMFFASSNGNAEAVSEDNAAALTSGNPPVSDTRDVGQYPSNGTPGAALINVSGTINLPIIGTDHDAPTGP